MSTEPSTIRRWSLALCGLLAATLLAVWVLAEPPVRADRTATAAPGTLATVGGEPITRAEVEAAVASELLQVEQQRHQVLEQGLQQAVARKVVELEAAERGVSAEELLQAEVAQSLTEPTDAEVDAFYEQRKEQIGRPKEEIADQIRRFLLQQRAQEVQTAYLDRLREKHGVVSYLDPFRLEVDAAGAPARGPEDAPVTIVEFSDFECPYCSRLAPTLDRVQERYPEQVRLVFRQFPLSSIHPNAMAAAQASLCAHEQDRFWEMHDSMFSEQRGLSVAQLKEKAAQLELDSERFDECLDSGRFAAQVQQDLAAGSSLGVSATPAMFVNGRLLSGAQPFETIAELIEDELARAEQRADG